METLLQDIHQAQTEGILTFDPLSNRKCLIIPILSCLLADNPRATDLTSTNGHTAIAPCRFCLVNKNQMKKGEHIADLRDVHTAFQVRSAVLGQNNLSKDANELLLMNYGIKLEMSSFEKIETLGFDVYRDFPVEILHTVLLVCSLSNLYVIIIFHRGPLNTW
jgi:hypothetical protein